MMTRTWRQVLSGERQEYKCLESMHFLGMSTPQTLRLFLHIVEYKSLIENSTSFLDRDYALSRVRNIKGCIFDANLEGQGW